MGRWTIRPGSLDISVINTREIPNQYEVCSSVKFDSEPIESPGGIVDRAEKTVSSTWHSDDYRIYEPHPIDVAHSLELLAKRIRESFENEAALELHRGL